MCLDPLCCCYKDIITRTRCAIYIDAYRTLAASKFQGLKDYALNSLDAAKTQCTRLCRKKWWSRSTTVPQLCQSGSWTNLVIFLCEFSTGSARACSSSKAIWTSKCSAAPTLRVLGDVVETYGSQRVQLLSPVLGTWLSSLYQSSDIVNVLRVLVLSYFNMWGEVTTVSKALRPRSER